MDHEERQADRAGCDRRADRYRGAEARLSKAGAFRRARRCKGDGGSAADRAWCIDRKIRPARRAYTRTNPLGRQPSLSASRRIELAVHRSAHIEQGCRRNSAEGSRGRLRFRTFLRVGAALSARA